MANLCCELGDEVCEEGERGGVRAARAGALGQRAVEEARLVGVGEPDWERLCHVVVVVVVGGG